MLLGTKQLIGIQLTSPAVSFLGKTLTSLMSAKNRGMIIDSHLTYDSHNIISQLVSPCLAKLVQINQVKNSFDKDTLPKMIMPLVFIKMFYCSTVWWNTSTSNLKKLQSIQNFASKIITGSRKFYHATPLLRQLNWLPVKQQLYLRVASPQTSFGVRLPRIHFSRGREMNGWQTNPKGRLRGG